MSNESTYQDGVHEAMAMYSRELEVHEPHFFDDDCDVDWSGMLGGWMADSRYQIERGVWVEYHRGCLAQCELYYNAIRNGS